MGYNYSYPTYNPTYNYPWDLQVGLGFRAFRGGGLRLRGLEGVGNKRQLLNIVQCLIVVGPRLAHMGPFLKPFRQCSRTLLEDLFVPFVLQLWKGLP